MTLIADCNCGTKIHSLSAKERAFAERKATLFFGQTIFPIREVKVLNFILLNTANVLYIFCYGVRDVLWLRVLAVSAMFLLLPFYANQLEPMYECMGWQAVFIAINAFWIIVIIRERRPPVMTEAETRVI